jgi:GTP pyrophosphokinase
MRQYELVERVLAYNPRADEGLLNRAYVYAMKAHGNQKRRSGDPYFAHPLQVAAILTDLKLDDATIATALLHDVIEDTPVTKADIDKYFGAQIGDLVEGLTKINKLDLVTKKAEQAENFRKLLVAFASDVRVLFVKLADRLHNMRTLEHNSPESRRRNSEETLDIYAPLAGRMGMQAMRDELEDLAFKWINPDAYAAVTGKLAALRVKNTGIIDEIKATLDERLTAAGVKAEISGREKKPYSIWKKMENRQISMEQLSDIYGFRVIVADIADCYRALGAVHGRWRAVPGRFKDYISTPKKNNYQSIHTTIIGPRNQRVELQIRTHDMHRVADYGIAAHALYKDGTPPPDTATASDKSEHPYRWLRDTVQTMLDATTSEELLENTKLELFHDQVFCFTPKGDIIALPRNAVALDFAYAVHTDVGNTTVGALVNGRQVPLLTRLRNGDEVRILTAAGAEPSSTWEKGVVTGRAKGAIRRATREKERKSFRDLGRRLVETAAERLSLTWTIDAQTRALPRLAFKSEDDLYAAVARGKVREFDVLRAGFPEAKIAEPVSGPTPKNRYVGASAEEGWFNLAKNLRMKFRLPRSADEESTDHEGNTRDESPAIALKGLRADTTATWAEAGEGVPGDRIVGVLTEGEGLKLFQIHSPLLDHYEHARWIDVTWDIDPENPERFKAKIAVTGLNAPGTLAQIAHVIGEADGNIDTLTMVTRGADFTVMDIVLEVWDLPHLTDIVAKLRAKPAVAKVERVFA